MARPGRASQEKAGPERASPGRVRPEKASTSDELANDRTFLAWLRTGISVSGLGFVVAKFALFLQRLGPAKSAPHQGLSTAVGVALVLAGGALMVVGYAQHARVLRSLHPSSGDGEARARWPLALTVGAIAGAVLLAVVVLVSNTGG